MSKPASEGEVEGGEIEEEGGCYCCCCDCFSCQSAAACLASRRGYRAREKQRGRRRKRLNFVLEALLSYVRRREAQARSQGVDLGTGHKAADLWITSSEYG